MESLLIEGGRVVDPATGIDQVMDVLLRDGRVAKVAAPGTLSGEGEKTIKAKGLIVAPGLIDMHVHLREHAHVHKETVETGTSAAVAGGFTAVCAMPNTDPVIDSAEKVHWMTHLDRKARAHVFCVAAATLGSMGEELTDFAALKKAGAVAVSDDGKPILDDKIMREALQKGGKLNLPVVQHAEDTRLTGGCSMNQGPTAFRLGLRGMPSVAEASIVERDIVLARETKGHVHVAHISTREAVDAVREAKKAGVRVTAEITPHHFTLIDDNVGEFDTNYKMNPPLRSADDRDGDDCGNPRRHH